MNDMVPVNMSVANAHAAAGIPADAELPSPPDPADLNNWQQEAYSLDVSLATTLGFPLGNISADYRRQALLFGVSRWRDVTQNNHSYRFGIALRAVVVVSEVKASAGLTLPVVAAKVELEGARATAQLLVRGYKGNKLADALPSWQSFGVDSYAQYMKSVSDIQQIVLADDVNITPELLATTVLAPQLPSATSAVGLVYALHAIKNGHPLYDAVAKIPTDDHAVIDALRSTYVALVGDDERAAPTADQKSAASEELHGLDIRDGWFH